MVQKCSPCIRSAGVEIGLLGPPHPRVTRDVDGAHEEGSQGTSGAAATDEAGGAYPA